MIWKDEAKASGHPAKSGETLRKYFLRRRREIDDESQQNLIDKLNKTREKK